jgi:hypothetical protein
MPVVPASGTDDRHGFHRSFLRFRLKKVVNFIIVGLSRGAEPK